MRRGPGFGSGDSPWDDLRPDHSADSSRQNPESNPFTAPSAAEPPDNPFADPSPVAGSPVPACSDRPRREGVRGRLLARVAAVTAAICTVAVALTGYAGVVSIDLFSLSPLRRASGWFTATQVLLVIDVLALIGCVVAAALEQRRRTAVLTGFLVVIAPLGAVALGGALGVVTLTNAVFADFWFGMARLVAALRGAAP